MHEMLFCTINDFTTYDNLSRYNVEGHKTCPIYEEKTTTHTLKHGRKTTFFSNLIVLIEG